MSSAARKLSLAVPGFPMGLSAETTGAQAEGGADEGPRWSDALGAWVFLSHADVRDGLRDERLGAARVDFHEAPLQGPGEELLQAFRKGASGRAEGSRELMALRRQAAPAFSPEALESFRPALRRQVGLLLSRVRDQGRMDAVRAVTGGLPGLVLAELMDLPSHHREGFLAWTRAIAEVQSPGMGLDAGALARRALLATREFLDYLGPLLAARRQSPGADLLSLMLRAHVPGTPNPEPRVATVALLLVSGLASFADQLGNGLHELLSQPERAQALRAQPALMTGALEEMLRLSPAVPVLHRTARQTFSLRGRTVREGDGVMLCISAANRDASVFPDPDQFLIDRDPFLQKHLSLGFGMHYRLDAGLVKHTLRALLEGMLEELPQARLDEERCSRLKSQGLHARGFESLPVRW